MLRTICGLAIALLLLSASPALAGYQLLAYSYSREGFPVQPGKLGYMIIESSSPPTATPICGMEIFNVDVAYEGSGNWVSWIDYRATGPDIEVLITAGDDELQYPVQGKCDPRALGAPGPSVYLPFIIKE